MTEPWRYANFLDAIDHWQTLLAGILALIGAIATVFYIHRQIQQANDLERARRSREEIAARAVLPLALTQLVQYAGHCLQMIKDHSIRPGLPPGIPLEPGLEVPKVDDDVIGTLQACVRYGDDAIVRQVSTLLALLQVQQARFRSLLARFGQTPEKRIPRFDAINAMTDAAESMQKPLGSSNTEESWRICVPDQHATILILPSSKLAL